MFRPNHLDRQKDRDSQTDNDRPTDRQIEIERAIGRDRDRDETGTGRRSLSKLISGEFFSRIGVGSHLLGGAVGEVGHHDAPVAHSLIRDPNGEKLLCKSPNTYATKAYTRRRLPAYERE
jgi:hypothetical protein